MVDRSPGIQYGFDLAQFNAFVNEAGVLKPTKWMFSTQVPNGMTGENFSLNAARNVQFWASSVNMPGATMVTHDVMRYGYGVAVKRPYSPGFGPMQIGFTADGMGATWTFFKQWLNLVINFDNRQANMTASNARGQAVYEVAYADDYTVDCVVSAFVDTGEEVLRLVLREAFPLSLSDTRLDWADTGGAARFNVNMHFIDWYQDNTSIQNNLQGATNGQQNVVRTLG